MADPADARYAIVDLHREGRRVSTIAAYLECSRQQVYRTLRRWIVEGVVGLDDKSRAPKRPARKATFGVMLQVRELQQNPLLGECASPLLRWPRTARFGSDRPSGTACFSQAASHMVTSFRWGLARRAGCPWPPWSG
jgi:hypothetical protein